MEASRREVYDDDDDDDREFFKVFIPHWNANKLKIPESFMRENDEIIQEKTKLKGRDGKIWEVEIEKTKEGVFMKNGWPSFVHHYALSHGEHLVFKYIRNSTFLVKIFGTNSCKKEALPIEDLIIVEEESKEKEVMMPSSPKQPKGSKRPRKVSSSREVQEHFAPEDPYFIKPVNYNDIHHLHLPIKLFSKQKVRLKKDMVLRNENGDNWPIKLLQRANGSIFFGGGWHQFWTDNRIRPCDNCKFTFSDGGSGDVIRVQILRGWKE